MYGDLRGPLEVVYMRFGKCMGTLGGHKGRIYEVLEVYRDPRGSLWVVYMRFLEVYGDPRGS